MITASAWSPGEARHRGRRQQEQQEWIAELAGEHRPSAHGVTAQHVRPERVQSPLVLRGGEAAARVGFEGTQRVGRRHRGEPVELEHHGSTCGRTRARWHGRPPDAVAARLIRTFGPARWGPSPAFSSRWDVDTSGMSTTLGIHCAEELVRLGVSTEHAVRVLMAELELSQVEADVALRLASEHVNG